jgi:hypothetical protein
MQADASSFWNGERGMAEVADSVGRDRKALDLRMEGRSFPFIAKELQFERAVDANEAFNRALRRSPDAERKKIVDTELKRLDNLASAQPADGDGDELTARRTRAINGLRARLLRD